tara:strand:+ start:4044 stop:4850 length:807 start_codon:yes stop_codon:yes gene_type:complete
MKAYNATDGKLKTDKIHLYEIKKYNTKKIKKDGKETEVKVAEVGAVNFKQKKLDNKNVDGVYLNGYLKANLKFVNDTIYVNHWPYSFEFGDRTDEEDEGKKDGTISEADRIYYYVLKNRHALPIRFRQWSLNVLSAPLKIRFGEVEEFTTGANLGAFFGPTFGKTTFVRRSKVDNKEYNSKWTTGLFLGADKLEFKYGTGVFIDDKETEETIKTSFISMGTGLLFSREKFTAGLLIGVDYGLGVNSKEWDYQGSPWLGLTLGYNLFSF